MFAGTSTSLPATTVEVAKAALGMTNPATASDFPVVCDSCLSPSKLGFVDETIQCISYHFINSQYYLLSELSWYGIFSSTFKQATLQRVSIYQTFEFWILTEDRRKFQIRMESSQTQE